MITRTSFLHVPLLVVITLLLFACNKQLTGDEENDPISTLNTSQYFDINWDSPDYDYNHSTGILVVKDNAALPPINSAFVTDCSGTDDKDPIRVVESITKEGDVFNVKTLSGTLENLFVNSKFTLTTLSETETKGGSNDMGLMIRPYAIEIDYQVSSKAGASADVVSLHFEKDRLELSSALSFEDICINLGLGFSVFFDFGEQQRNGVTIGKLNEMEVKTYANYDASFAIQLAMHQNISCEFNILEPLRIRVYFSAAPPVWISIAPKIGVMLTEETFETHDFTLKASSSLKGELAVQWSLDKGSNCIHSIQSDFDFEYAGFDNYAPQTNYSFSVGAPFLKTELSLYDLFAFFYVRLSPTFTQDWRTTIVNTQFPSWSESRSIDGLLSAGLEFDLISYNKLSTSIGVLPHFDSKFLSRPLKTYPKGLELDSDSPLCLRKGETASFFIIAYGEDYHILTNTFERVPVNKALVHLIPYNGAVMSEYIYSNKDGIAEAFFSPDESRDSGSLVAELIDGDGNVIHTLGPIEFTYESGSDDDEDDYVPTAEDCVFYYTRKYDPKADFVWSLSDLFTPGNTFFENTVLEHEEYFSAECEENEIAGKVTFDKPILKVPDYAFRGRTGLLSFKLPESCQEIGKYAFWITSLKGTITIPNHVRKIGDFAFYCTEATRLILGSRVEEIGQGAFSSSSISETPVFPDSIRIIGGDAFAGSNIKGPLVLPNQLEDLGYFAFSECGITGTVTIPETVTALGSYVFYNCNELDTVYVPQQFRGEKRMDGFKEVEIEEWLLGGSCHALILFY